MTILEKPRQHYFPANDCTITTWELPSGEWGACREGEAVRGRGRSRWDAIADLVTALQRQETETNC